MTRRTTSTVGTNREAVRDRAKGYYANRTPEQIENDQRTRAAWYQKNKKKQRRVQKARQEARRGVYQPDDSVTTHTATEITKVLNGVERSGFRNPRDFAAWRPDDQTKVLIGQINKVLAEYSEHLPLTGRQIYYRLIDTYSRPKGKQFEDRLYEVLQRGRRARIFPMTAIRDDGAIKDETQWWEDGDEWLAAIRSEAGKVRLDRQEGQPKRLILYCEAAGMVPQLARVADEYGIPVMSGGGFDSLTEKHRLAESNDDTEVLHIGDFDPSGIHVFVSLAEDVSAFAKHYGRTIDFTRLAVTPDQIEELSLNTSPLKRTDHSHMLAFSGDVTCQAEAIPPDELARIVREAIEGRLDRDAYDAGLEREDDLHTELEEKLED